MREHWFLPSLADIFFLAVFLTLTVVLGQTLLDDADTGYHITAGHLILESHTFLRHDLFSFYTPPMPYTAHEWLAEIVMVLIHRTAGLTGVVIFFAILISLVYALLFRMIRAQNVNFLVAVVVVILATVTSRIHWLARPHVFTFLLALIWYEILDLHQYRDRNLLRWLPPLMLLWVNLHGGFVTGFMLLGIYLAGNLIRALSMDAAQRGPHLEKVRALAITTGLCLLAALVNPAGYHALVFPFKVVSNTYIMDHIQEFLSPNFHGFFPFKYLLLVMIAVFACSPGRLNAIEIIIILSYLNMSLYAMRFIPFFAMFSAPIIARHADLCLADTTGRAAHFLRERSRVLSGMDGLARGYVWPVAAVLVVVFLAAGGTWSFHFDPRRHPVDAVAFLKREPIPGNMYNEYQFGTYMTYAAWREYKVFIDGRADMYGDGILKDYFKVKDMEVGWEKVLDKYRITWIFFTADSPLSRYLIKNGEWHLVYADKVANILVKKIPEYQYLMDRYSDITPLPPDRSDPQ